MWWPVPCCFSSEDQKLYIFCHFSTRIWHVGFKSFPLTYCQVSNIRRTLVCNYIFDHSDVAGTTPVGAAPSTLSFSTSHLASIHCAKTTSSRGEKYWSFGIWCGLCKRSYGTWIWTSSTGLVTRNVPISAPGRWILAPQFYRCICLDAVLFWTLWQWNDYCITI